MEEIWKPIYEYEGLYEISNLGRVKSLEKFRKNGKKRKWLYSKRKNTNSS